MFGLSGGEILTLLVVGVVLMGPSRLPQTARQFAIFIKKARALAAGATAELRETLGPGFEEIEISDLNPKNLIKKQFSEVIEEHIEVLNEPIMDLKTPLNISHHPMNLESSSTSQEIETPPITQSNSSSNPSHSQIDPDLI